MTIDKITKTNFSSEILTSICCAYCVPNLTPVYRLVLILIGSCLSV